MGAQQADMPIWYYKCTNIKYATEQERLVKEQAKVHRACWLQQAVAVGKGECRCDHQAGKIER